MSEMFLLTLNGFRELKRLRWLVWLISHDYFSYGTTTSTSDLLSRTMVIFAVIVLVVVAAVAASHMFEVKTNFFLFGTRHFHLLTKDSQKIIHSF